MLDPQTYNSRDARYKQPFGALPAGETVELTLRPARRSGFSSAFCRVRLEFRNNEERTFPMPWVGMEGDRDLFSCAFDLGEYVGLVWYSFVLEGIDGRRAESQIFQLTVYDGSEAVPAWFGEGMTYQIFPDRFRRTSIPDPTGMVGGRWVHQNWEEEPAYRPDEKGEIRNRDFFGGDLKGVREKLPYLKNLGVETIYFCPVFEAAENHRYGTANYERIDPMLGTNEDFTALCDAAHALGMKVMLDGVFNHTGFVSKYFNGDGFYPGPGAAQSKDSPYYGWFNFREWPRRYDAWWGIYSLPAVNEGSESYQNYIIRDEDSVVRRWLRAGADGWRLDVADELPDSFVHAVHAAARAEKPSAVVIGEVWEDGTTKIAYDVRRRHILGGHCDGLMNYPFRNAIIAFLSGGDAERFMGEMETLRENYPPFAYYSAMNALGTHDTPRILTLLGEGSPRLDQSRDWRAGHRLTPDQHRRGISLLKLGALVLFSFPGSPTVYYGDEAGMEGFEDPFNRRTFPWGQEDGELEAWFAALGKARGSLAALRRGSIRYVRARGRVLSFLREAEGQSVLCAVNAGSHAVELESPWGGEETIRLAPMSGVLLCKEGDSVRDALAE